MIGARPGLSPDQTPGWGRAGLHVLAGAGAALGLAPFDLWPATIIGLALALAWVAPAPTARAAFWTGWRVGLGYFAVALHWIVEPFLVDAATHGWMAPFALVVFAGGLALFWGAAAGLAARLLAGTRARGLAFAALLVLSEAARGVVFSGFPWALPGHALIDTAYLGVATWVGGLGLTALLTGFAALLWIVVEHPGRRSLALAMFAGIVAIGMLAPTPSAPPVRTDAATVRLVQPNAPQHLKWQPDMVPVFWERGLSLTAAGGEDGMTAAPDLIIWPETSLPVLLDRSDAARVRLSAAAGAAQVIVGAQRIAGTNPRNSLAVLTPEGMIDAVYDKHRLVPFGEYMPARDLFTALGIIGLAEVLPGGYTAGTGPRTLDLGGTLGRAFAMICYEAIFPQYLRQVAERPDWMIHITNDAWFGTFSGPWQHLAIARLRAAEQGLPLLRAANTGVSAVIDARGQIVAQLDLGIAGYLDARLPPPLPPTVYARTGDGPILGFVVFLLVGAIVWGRRREGPLKPPQ